MKSVPLTENRICLWRRGTADKTLIACEHLSFSSAHSPHGTAASAKKFSLTHTTEPARRLVPLKQCPFFKSTRSMQFSATVYN